MLRPASRCLLRQPVRHLRPQTTRYLSTAPPHLKSRSWRNSAARWTLAIAGVYFYNTSTLFAEEPAPTLRDPPGSEEELPTIQSLSPSSRFQPPHPEDRPAIAPTPKATSPPSIDPKAPDPATQSDPSSPADLEEEAAQQGAFNEETGEINWDCSCLGGMAYGPCGPEFREAFSCFVFSKEEPKGMDCIEKFKGMQNCFREHPDIYGAELEDDDDDIAQDEGGKVAGALPEDTHTVAAAEGSVREAAKETKDSIVEATRRGSEEGKKIIAEAEDKAEEKARSLSEQAVSAKDAITEKANDIKQSTETYIKSQ